MHCSLCVSLHTANTFVAELRLRKRTKVEDLDVRIAKERKGLNSSMRSSLGARRNRSGQLVMLLFERWDVFECPIDRELLLGRPCPQIVHHVDDLVE